MFGNVQVEQFNLSLSPWNLVGKSLKLKRAMCLVYSEYKGQKIAKSSDGKSQPQNEINNTKDFNSIFTLRFFIKEKHYVLTDE